MLEGAGLHPREKAGIGEAFRPGLLPFLYRRKQVQL